MGKESIKVLHIDTEQGWRGGQQQVTYLLSAMVADGYETALVCQPQSHIQNYCLEKGLPHFPIRMFGEIDFIAGLRIAWLCRKKGYTILHLHSAHALAIGLWAKLFCPSIKLIAVRRVDFHLKKNKFSQVKYRTMLLDKIVCISEGIKKVLIQDGIPETKIVTIHSGIDIHKFDHYQSGADLKQKYGIPANQILVGTIAVMVGHKDYPNLLNAAKIVIESQENVTFCAVGDGPLKKSILELAHKLELGKRFIFAGFQNDIGSFLNMFDIFVLASRLEGLGTSILDAQSVGLPIVACHAGGIPEIVWHEQNGLLVPRKDAAALAQAILKLTRDEELRKKLGSQSLQTVGAFDIKNTVAKNMELYQLLMKDES